MSKQTKKEETAPATVAQTQVATVKSADPFKNLAALGASPELIERIENVRDNLESVENFKLPRIKMINGAGFEISDGADPKKSIEGVLLHTRKTNVYYKEIYDPGKIVPPDCVSQDGNTPDASVKNPVAASCAECPMSKFESARNGKGKACRNLKPIYLLLGDAIMPRQLSVTPTSLKAANKYLMDLTEQGLSYRTVITKIEAYKSNPADTHMTLRFSKLGKIDDASRQKDVAALRTVWLPVMDSQVVEQSEIQREEAGAPAAPTGEY